MKLSRRQALQQIGLASAWLASRQARFANAAPPVAPGGPQPMRGKMTMPRAPMLRPLQVGTLAKFVDKLPIPDVHRSAETVRGSKVPLYRVAMRAVEAAVHRELKPTRWWSFGAGVPGPTFDLRAGQPIAVEWKNELPAQHFLPIDHTICGAEQAAPAVRTIVHVHGAKVPPEADGYPDQWFTAGTSKVVHYPNQQDAAGLWYHDHAMGIERLNQYAGLFGAYLLRDAVEDSHALPDGPHEVPLVFFDRFLDQDGQLIYPTSGMPATPWVAEMYGDAILVNGKLTPTLDVERRAYRFRLCNACNARFVYLSIPGGAPGGVPLVQIGSDQGLLPKPATRASLILAPGERIDLVIDFSALGGQALTLMNQAIPLMQFRVGSGAAAPAWKPPAVLRDVPRIPRAAAVKTRPLALEEFHDDAHGMLMLLGRKRWHDPVTEKPVLGSTEIWELINCTEDTHPIHLHLVRFQILERQQFDVEQYLFERTMKLMGPVIPPDAHERGWKDTVQAFADHVTRIIVKFDGYAGRYVWHCHVLEHAANEMMRPFEVVRR